RSSDREDVHHRHHPEPQGPHGAVRQHHGGAAGIGQSRRPRRDPCRGQRPRHAYVREADARGRTSFHNMAEVHTTLSEDLAFNRVIRLAANIPGSALYMLHTSAATGVRAIATARNEGVPIYGETLHQYLMYSAEDYKRPNGQIYHTYPSLKFAEDHAALWAATNHGAIQTVATDEICCPLKYKLQGSRIDDTTGGNAGVEPRVSLIYTETVEKRGYDLTQFVGLVS